MRLVWLLFQELPHKEGKTCDERKPADDFEGNFDTGEQEPRKNRDDREDDEKFNKGEPLIPIEHGVFHTLYYTITEGIQILCGLTKRYASLTL